VDYFEKWQTTNRNNSVWARLIAFNGCYLAPLSVYEDRVLAPSLCLYDHEPEVCLNQRFLDLRLTETREPDLTPEGLQPWHDPVYGTHGLLDYSEKKKEKVAIAEAIPDGAVGGHGQAQSPPSPSQAEEAGQNPQDGGPVPAQAKEREDELEGAVGGNVSDSDDYVARSKEKVSRWLLSNPTEESRQSTRGGYTRGSYTRGSSTQPTSTRGAYNRGNSNRGGYNRGNSNRGNSNRGGYNRGGFTPRGGCYNRGNYTRGGSSQSGTGKP
jgi:hypothetical protein